MLPILFQVGGFKFYSFGTFIALGTIIAGLFVGQAARNRKLKTHYLFDTVLFTLLFALIASRLTYYFLYQNQFQSFGQVFLFWQGGLVALGGLIVGFLTYLYFIRREKDPVWQMLDIGALGLLLGWAIGKYGCHLSTCTIGRDATGLLSYNGAYAVDLLAAVWSIVWFGVMFFVWRRNRLSDGVIFFLSMEGLFLGQLLINTLSSDFGTGLMRVGALFTLALIVALYLLFWKLHGPKIQKNRWGINIKNFVFKRKV